jgi:hypothetical protein
MHKQTHHSIALLLLGHTAGLPNLWHTAFTAVRICLFLLPDQLLCIVKNMCMYTCILHCIEIVYELTLLPNNTACETFLHKRTDIRKAFSLLITGPPDWLWLDEYMTLDKIFYNLLFKQEVAAASVTATYSSLCNWSRKP